MLQNFFGGIIRHEIFHFFIPYIENNSCWSEGVTDFMTYWYNDTIKIKLIEKLDEYTFIKDKNIKSINMVILMDLKKWLTYLIIII